MKTAFWIVSSILLVGCTNLSQLNDPERTEQVTGIDKHSSYPIMRRDYFERINLLELVDPERGAASKFEAAWKTAEKGQNKTDSPETQSDPNEFDSDKLNEFGAKYDLVFAHFRQRDDISDDDKRRLRNSIQERILSSSMSRCNVFKTFLRRDQADQNFLLGSLTTAAGIFGAVLPGVRASHNLAGAAGLFSGIRSEYNQAYYSNLAAHVIVRGIETKQELVYSRIQSEGQSKNIDIYPLEAAIKDAVYWDGLCSVVVGLDQAAASIDATNEPGLDAATRTLLRARLVKEASELTREDLLNPKTLESIGLAGSKLGMSLVGSARGASADADVDMFVFTTKMTERLDASVTDAANEIERAVNVKRKSIIDILKKTNDKKAQELEKSAPKKGVVTDSIKAVLKKKILDPMKLDACYLNVAAPAVQQRISAMRSLDNATTDADKVTAQGEIIKADQAILGARGTLSQKEKLVKLDIDTYRKEQLAAVNKITTESANQLAELKELAPDPIPLTSKGQGCSN